MAGVIKGWLARAPENAAPDGQLVRARRSGGKFKNQSAKFKEISNSKPHSLGPVSAARSSMRQIVMDGQHHH